MHVYMFHSLYVLEMRKSKSVVSEKLNENGYATLLRDHLVFFIFLLSDNFVSDRDRRVNKKEIDKKYISSY